MAGRLEPRSRRLLVGLAGDPGTDFGVVGGVVHSPSFAGSRPPPIDMRGCRDPWSSSAQWASPPGRRCGPTRLPVCASSLPREWSVMAASERCSRVGASSTGSPAPPWPCRFLAARSASRLIRSMFPSDAWQEASWKRTWATARPGFPQHPPAGAQGRLDRRDRAVPIFEGLSELADAARDLGQDQDVGGLPVCFAISWATAWARRNGSTASPNPTPGGGPRPVWRGPGPSGVDR